MQNSSINPLLTQLVEQSNELLNMLASEKLDVILSKYGEYENGLLVLQQHTEALISHCNTDTFARSQFETLLHQHQIILTEAERIELDLSSEIRHLNKTKKAMDAYGQ